MKREREPRHQCTQYQVVNDLLNLTYQIEVIGFYYNGKIDRKNWMKNHKIKKLILSLLENK